MSERIFRDEACRSQLESWYPKFLARIQAPLEQREIPTTIGSSHVLVAGDTSRPPLVLVHGALSSSAHAVSEMTFLLEHFHIIAPDVPGQSVKAPSVRLSVNSDAHAKWLLEVLDGLGLENVALCGVSWGGFVAMQTAAQAPHRFSKLVLIVPAGIISSPVWAGITRAAIPMMRYRLSPSENTLRGLVEPLFSTWDNDWAHYMGDAMRCFLLNLKPPPLAKAEDLRDIHFPTLVFGADNDIYFPARSFWRAFKRFYHMLKLS
jgi:pimeloyl-ACP methyl ester carboxylesterase